MMLPRFITGKAYEQIVSAFAIRITQKVLERQSKGFLSHEKKRERLYIHIYFMALHFSKQFNSYASIIVRSDSWECTLSTNRIWILGSGARGIRNIGYSCLGRLVLNRGMAAYCEPSAGRRLKWMALWREHPKCLPALFCR